MDRRGEERKAIFLKGRKVILRPLNKETDLESCLRWVNDEEIRQYIKRSMPMTVQMEANWLDSMGTKEDDITLGIETLDGVFIGSMGIHNINWKDRTAMTGALIGEKEYWGKGYGTDAKMILLNYAFNSLNLRKICSSVVVYNKRSIDYSLHCGYKLEGVRKKQIFKKGKYQDEVLLAIFKEDWIPVWRKYNKTGKIR